MQKACTRCGEEKSLEEFRYNARTGRYSYKCQNCWKPSKEEKYLHSSIERFLNRRLSMTRINARSPSRINRGYGNTLTLEDVMRVYERQGGLCAITGVELTHSAHTPQTNASIDRVDSDLGYEPDNVRLVCAVVNIMRNRLTDEELGGWSHRIAKGLGFAD